MKFFELSRRERLRGKTNIDALFTQGDTVFSYPLRMTFTLKDQAAETENAVCSFFISVPKRNFKRAVKRNRIRRRIREAYRLNKRPFLDALDQKNIYLQAAILFVGKEETSFDLLMEKMPKLLHRAQQLALEKQLASPQDCSEQPIP